MEPQPEERRLARRLCFWFSVVGGSATAASMATLVAYMREPWAGLAAYAAGFNDTQVVTFVLWFLLGIVFVPLVASLHALASGWRRPLTLVALAFAIMYATIVDFNYGLQFTFVRQSLYRGDLVGLEPWIAANPTSAIFAVDLLGYLFQGLSTLFLAPMFRGGRVASAVKWLFVLNGIEGVAGLAAITLISFGSAGSQWVGVVILLAWGIPLSAALFLLAYGLFRGLVIPMVPAGPVGSKGS